MAVSTHWGRATHICVRKLSTIGSDNGLLPDRRQAIIRTNAGILLSNFREILIEILIFSSKEMHLKISSGKWRPFCLGLNVLRDYCSNCPVLLHCFHPPSCVDTENLLRDLTLYVLNFAEGTQAYIYILYHYSTLISHRYLKSFLR